MVRSPRAVTLYLTGHKRMVFAVVPQAAQAHIHQRDIVFTYHGQGKEQLHYA
jgi:uncharacterized protein YcgL (UPF0745 family)